MTATEFKPDTDGVFYNLPAERYHAAPGFSHSMSLHMDPPCRLPVYLSKREEPSIYMILGTLAHAMILEPDKPLPQIAVRPDTYPAPADCSAVKQKKAMPGDPLDWHGSAKYCQQWVADAEAAGLIVLTQKEYSELEGMVRTVAETKMLSKILRNAQTEVSVFSAFAIGEGVVLRKVRLDIVPRGNALIDLKTVDEASVDTFRNKLEYDGWATQAANAIELWNAQNPEHQKTEFGFVLIERKPPHVLIHCQVQQEDIEWGRLKMYDRVESYYVCSQKGEWPGYPEAWISVPRRGRREL